VGAQPAGPPSKTTIWRVLTHADADAFDAAIGAWLTQVAGYNQPPPATDDGPQAWMQVRLDGKTIRGAIDAEGNQPQLLAALIAPDAAHSVVAVQGCGSLVMRFELRR
jgi:hypothetical protein